MDDLSERNAEQEEQQLRHTPLKSHWNEPGIYIQSRMASRPQAPCLEACPSLRSRRHHSLSGNSGDTNVLGLNGRLGSDLPYSASFLIQ